MCIGLRLQPLYSFAAVASLFTLRAPRLWTDLPANIARSPKLASFLHELDKWLHSADFCFVLSY